MNIVECWRRLCWSVIYLGPRRDITIDTFNGRLSLDSKDWLIGKYLYVKRSHEAGEMETVIRLLKAEGFLAGPSAGKCVLNVGANIGMSSIGLLQSGHFERAIAFEPAPNTYRLLLKNIEQNGLRDHIRPFPFALSSSDGELEMELSRDNSGDNRIGLTDDPGFFAEEKRRTVKVAVKTLDHFLSENPVLEEEHVELAWVDIQGHEGQFLRGARQFFTGKGIPVASEFWPYGIGRSGMSAQEFGAILSGLFSHFYVVGSRPERKLPIAEIASLFRTYSGPRQMCVVLLLPAR